MTFEEISVNDKLGRTVVIRSARPEDAEALVVVHKECARAVAGLHVVLTPERILEECLDEQLGIGLAGIEGIHQVRVVEHRACRLLGEFLTLAIHQVEEVGIGQILDVVHHRSSRCGHVHSQLRHIGSSRVARTQDVEEFLHPVEVFQFYLILMQHVHLNHQVHHLVQTLCEVGMLQEEGIVSVMKISAHVLQGLHLLQYLRCDALVTVLHLTYAIGLQVEPHLQVEILSQGESLHHIQLHESVQIGIFPPLRYHAGSCEHNMNLRETLVDFAQHAGPSRLLVHVVNEQRVSAVLVKLCDKFHQVGALEEEIVHVDVETSSLAH